MSKSSLPLYAYDRNGVWHVIGGYTTDGRIEGMCSVLPFRPSRRHPITTERPGEEYLCLGCLAVEQGWTIWPEGER